MIDPAEAPMDAVTILTTSGFGYPAGPYLHADGVNVVRLLLAICSIGLLAVAIGHTMADRTMQGLGHALAGVGLGIAAAFGDGVAVWIGICMAGVGSALLIRDARRRGPRRQPFT